MLQVAGMGETDTRLVDGFTLPLSRVLCAHRTAPVDERPITLGPLMILAGNAKVDGKGMENDGTTTTPPAATPQEQQQHNHQREDLPAPASGTTSSPGSTSPAKKRRKVNHGMSSYRQPHLFPFQPCADICSLEQLAFTVGGLRNIGHLCHDERREPAKRARIQSESAIEEDDALPKQVKLGGNSSLSSIDRLRPEEQALQETKLDTAARTVPTNGHTSSAQLVEPSPASGAPGEPSGVKNQPPHSDWTPGGQNQFQDMHNFHTSYMFNAPEVTSEYNLFNDFLSTSLLNDGAMFPGDEAQGLYSTSPLISTVVGSINGYGAQYLPGQTSRAHSSGQVPAAVLGDKVHRSSTMATDKARETYYMTAADPAGSDTPEERMDKLLEAKYDAGMLKPFNYLNGYARLDRYIDEHLHIESRQRIRRALDKFRPTFRERMRDLTDYELVRVEMWFERSLMEYDRVFASMAIPACCWRRTGEICRGNKEMAQLIHVPIEQLRDGKLALHDIIVEKHLVNYWETFREIAFDNSQKTMLTSCSLRSPNQKPSLIGQLGVTEQIVERAASYEQKLQRVLQDGQTRDLASSIRRLCDEYHLTRITLAWRQERLDLAEILLTRLSPKKSVIEAPVAESLADILLEIGRDQAAKHQYTLAIQWLEKARDILSSQIPESLSNDADELQSCILHTTIHVLLKERGEGNIPKAWNIIQELEGESENRVAVLLLKLELFHVDPAATQDYHEILAQIVRQIHITDTNVRTILHHVHELRRRSTRLAHAILVVLLTERLLVMGETSWMEKTLVTIVWNYTTSTDLASTPDALGELFAVMAATSSSLLGTSATHAAQIIIDPLGQLKLNRKRLLCALGKSDLVECREISHQMSDSTKNDSSTRYLLYKLALKCQDVDLGEVSWAST
ncbi:MAG: hypothetical protein Q9218_000342 [Villophora microphyllina]